MRWRRRKRRRIRRSRRRREGGSRRGDRKRQRRRMEESSDFKLTDSLNSVDFLPSNSAAPVQFPTGSGILISTLILRVLFYMFYSVLCLAKAMTFF